MWWDGRLSLDRESAVMTPCGPNNSVLTWTVKLSETAEVFIVFFFDFEYVFAMFCGFTRMFAHAWLWRLLALALRGWKIAICILYLLRKLHIYRDYITTRYKAAAENAAGRQHRHGTIIWSCQSVLDIHGPKRLRCLNKSTLNYAQIYSHVQNAANACDNECATT